MPHNALANRPIRIVSALELDSFAVTLEIAQFSLIWASFRPLWPLVKQTKFNFHRKQTHQTQLQS